MKINRKQVLTCYACIITGFCLQNRIPQIGKLIETYRNQQEIGFNLYWNIAESNFPYRKTYVYIHNFLLEGNRPKITMESDSPYRKTYVYIQPMYMYITINYKTFLAYVQSYCTMQNRIGRMRKKFSLYTGSIGIQYNRILLY